MIFYNPVHCQIINQENTNIFTMSPNGVLDNVFDNYGNKYNLLDVLINPNKTSSSTTLLNCSSNSYFNLYFENGCGMEIVGNADHDQRRLVVCKVFEDISNFINSPLTATGNKVNIWVRNINAIPNVTNSVLGLATGFYTGPSSNISGGILENEIWKTIHLGVDSYSNISAPLVPNSANASSTGFYYHGMVAFNFNNINNLPVINWNNNLGTSCPANKYDLYSVALHEITHALGFASLINSSGNSKLGANFKYFSRFDKFLKNNSTNDFLLTTSNTCTSALYDYGFNPLLDSSILQPQTTPTSPCSTDNTICGSSIKYVGTNTVPTYTPNCFANESSLSHFEDQCFSNLITGIPYLNNSYFVMSDTNGSGVTKRYLKPEERNTLCDIGYSTKTTYGSATTYQGVPPANYYGNVVCGGIRVAGINDGLNPDGSYAFIGDIITPGTNSTNITIGGNLILNNDIGGTNFECLQDLTAVSSITPNFGSITTNVTFSSSVGGLHLLRYVPVSASGQRGNITYVYVYVTEPYLGSCIPTQVNACDLVKNGGFEEYSSSYYNRACGWGNAMQSPDYFNTNPFIQEPIPCNRFGLENTNFNIGNAYEGFGVSENNNLKFQESIITKLTAPLVAGVTYQLSFDISVAESSKSLIKPQAYFSTSGTIYSLSFGDIPVVNPAMLFTNPTFCSKSNGWQTLTFNVTSVNGGEQYLYLGGINYSQLSTLQKFQAILTPIVGCPITVQTTTSLFSYCYIDNVSLKITDGAILDLPPLICINQTLSNLTSYLSAVPTNGVFSGTGIMNDNGLYSFTNATVGNYTINYTYENNLGCPVTISDTINVTNTSTPNTIVLDAIDDDFSSMPISNSSGGVTTSVYNNDIYNNLPSNITNIGNVTFSLVSPVAIPGATINNMGLINIPANSLFGTYTLTYRMQLLGSCNFFDTANVKIILTRINVSPNISNSIRANNSVEIIKLQSNGKIIISGTFTTYNNITKNRFCRLNSNLTLDQTFLSLGASTQSARAKDIVVQNDNKIVVIGGFSSFGGSNSGFGVARLLENGAADPNFNNGGIGIGSFGKMSGKVTYACALQSDRKILIGGDFYYYNGIKRVGVVRLLPTGAIDNSFVPTEINDSFYRSVITKILVQLDGKILLEGFFNISNLPVMNLIRLNIDGSYDTSFNPGNTDGSSPFVDNSLALIGPLSNMALQPDGKIVVVGAFTKYNNTDVKNIVRLLTNGLIDPTFNIATGVERAINDVLIETYSNKIIIAGEFSVFGTSPVKRMLRLTITGNLDNTFNIGSGTSNSNTTTCSYCINFIKSILIQPDAKIIVGGRFTSFNNITAGNITRIYGDFGVQAKGGSSYVVYSSETEIDTKPNDVNILIYPNPSSGIFTIDLQNEETAYTSIRIYNILGKKILTSSLNPKEINLLDLSEFSSGCYFAILENEIKNISFKLIKN